MLFNWIIKIHYIFISNNNFKSRLGSLLFKNGEISSAIDNLQKSYSLK
jgi:hypothetical protein